jgi:hypothetical protein
MKTKKVSAALLCAIIALAAQWTFPASLEKADSTVPSARPDNLSLNGSPKADSAESSVQQIKKEDDEDEDQEKDDEKDSFHYKIEHPREVFNSIHKYTDSMSRRGFGFGGGPMAGMYAVNIKPFVDLTQRIAPLRGKNFPFGSLDYKPFFMSGGMGFVGVGNGLRLGGGGMSGVRHFPSSSYGRDSSINLTAKITWGGFLIEKYAQGSKYAFTVGGYIGSGSLDADWVEVNSNYSAFIDYNNDDDDNTDKIKAYFGLIELHAGIVYHIARFMHACGDLSVPIMVSADGFAPWTKEFISISPGVRVRIIFGNLG